MPRSSGKAAISLKGNAKNLPDIQLSHMAYQEHFKDVYTEDEIRKLLARPSGRCKGFGQFTPKPLHLEQSRKP